MSKEIEELVDEFANKLADTLISSLAGVAQAFWDAAKKLEEENK